MTIRKVLHRLTNKRGVTLVEVIVVIAIISVMAGMLVPLAINDNRVTEVNAKARSFYFQLQGVLTDYKLDMDYDDDSGTGSHIGKGKYYLMMQVDSTTAAKLVSFDLKADKTTLGTGNPELTLRSGETITDAAKVLAERLLPTADFAADGVGYYYAVFQDYKITAAYFSKRPLADLTGPFNKDNYVNSYPVGAFPYDMGDMGDTFLP